VKVVEIFQPLTVNTEENGNSLLELGETKKVDIGLPMESYIQMQVLLLSGFKMNELNSYGLVEGELVIGSNVFRRSMPEIHVIPVDPSLTPKEAWKELCIFGRRTTFTGPEKWVAISCDKEECFNLKD
jgi:hypothetical protein